MNNKNNNLTFGEALESLKQGNCIARKGWNGKEMYLFLSTASNNALGLQGNRNAKLGDTVLSCICMRTAKKEIVVGWLASQTDMLSNDWFVLG